MNYLLKQRFETLLEQKATATERINEQYGTETVWWAMETFVEELFSLLQANAFVLVEEKHYDGEIFDYRAKEFISLHAERVSVDVNYLRKLVLEGDSLISVPSSLIS